MSYGSWAPLRINTEVALSNNSELLIATGLLQRKVRNGIESSGSVCISTHELAACGGPDRRVNRPEMRVSVC